MFNNKNNKRITALETKVEKLLSQNQSMFVFIKQMAKEKYLGKYFYKETKELDAVLILSRNKSYIRVNSIYSDGKKLLLKCTCIVQSDNIRYTISEIDLGIDFSGLEITEKEFQDAYKKYAISSGLLPKKEEKEINKKEPKK